MKFYVGETDENGMPCGFGYGKMADNTTCYGLWLNGKQHGFCKFLLRYDNLLRSHDNVRKYSLLVWFYKWEKERVRLWKDDWIPKVSCFTWNFYCRVWFLIFYSDRVCNRIYGVSSIVRGLYDLITDQVEESAYYTKDGRALKTFKRNDKTKWFELNSE